MGGSGIGIEDDWDLSEASSDVRTIVLVGKIGNGKSATGNSILGRKAFKSGGRLASVTSSCEMQRTELSNGQILNVIDTPGLFDLKFGAEEIVNCIRLAKDGIHAIVVVLSIRNRFSVEDSTAIPILKTFFGEKIMDYMIILFTGGDDLEEDESFEDFWNQDCLEAFQEILRLCKNRVVLFDNKTKDESKKSEQLQKLLDLVNTITEENGGQPFSDEFFVEMKEGAMKLRDQRKQVELLEGYSKQEILKIRESIDKSHAEQLSRITEMVEKRLQETTSLLIVNDRMLGRCLIFKMGGSLIDDDWDLSESSNEVRTVVLVGRAGNGKSATGNSILGRKAFKSGVSSQGVTSTCEMQRSVLRDGQVVNVIDTPGLFDFTMEAEFVGKEILNCIRLAKDGIHALVVVFSVRTRFTKEEKAVMQSLLILFGEKILDYMIIVFTGGDDLEDDDETLEGYLGRECPEAIQEVLQSCKNRVMVFDNKTKDVTKKAEQVQQLLDLVNLVMAENGGQPFTDDLFVQLKEGDLRMLDQEKEVESLQGYTKQEISDIRDNIHKTYEERLKRITDMIEQRLIETTQRLEQKLAEEQAARLKAEKEVQTAQKKSNYEIRKLRENLEKAQKETEEFRKLAENGRCAIL